MLVRDATEADLPGILAIYNDVIATSTAVWTEAASTLEDRQAWFAARKALGYPILIAEDEQGVAGFASFGDFRAWPGYRFTVEHSIHVRNDARRSGVGRLLLPALIGRARALGKRVLIAGIDGENQISIDFHRKFGFTDSGRLIKIGYKFGRWIDLAFMQLNLEEA
jgi:L-amino acid N-acyltransferase YncA